MRKEAIWLGAFCLLGLAIAPACTDEGEDDVGTGGSTASVTTGSGGATTTTSSSGSTTTGGDGGGGGGGGPTCLPRGATSAYFAIDDASLCAVEKWSAADLTLDPYGITPTWGSHGGPLTFEGSATQATFSRWTLGMAGALTASDESVNVTVPAGAFWGSQALDVGSSLTVASWTGMSFSTEGGFVVKTGANAHQEDAIGVFGLATTQGRLLFTGLSPAGVAAAGDAGLYAALVTTSALTDDGTVATWGLATGPVVTDTEGNVFAVNTDYVAANQEIRAFAAADIAPGSPATEGVTLATLPDFGDAMAVLGPSDDAPGLVLLQPNDGATFAHLDVVGVPFTIEAGAIAASGTPSTVLTLAAADTNLTLMTDDDGRLWVGAANAEGGSGAVFFVIDRVP